MKARGGTFGVRLSAAAALAGTLIGQPASLFAALNRAATTRTAAVSTPPSNEPGQNGNAAPTPHAGSGKKSKRPTTDVRDRWSVAGEGRKTSAHVDRLETQALPQWASARSDNRRPLTTPVAPEHSVALRQHRAPHQPQAPPHGPNRAH